MRKVDFVSSAVNEGFERGLTDDAEESRRSGSASPASLDSSPSPSTHTRGQRGPISIANHPQHRHHRSDPSPLVGPSDHSPPPALNLTGHSNQHHISRSHRSSSPSSDSSHATRLFHDRDHPTLSRRSSHSCSPLPSEAGSSSSTSHRHSESSDSPTNSPDRRRRIVSSHSSSAISYPDRQPQPSSTALTPSHRSRSNHSIPSQHHSHPSGPALPRARHPSNMSSILKSKTPDLEDGVGSSYFGFGPVDDADSGSDVDDFEGEDGDEGEADQRWAHHYWQEEGHHSSGPTGELALHNGTYGSQSLHTPGRVGSMMRRRIMQFKELKGVTAYDISCRRLTEDDSGVSGYMDLAGQPSPSSPAGHGHNASDLRPDERERFEWQDMLTNVLTGEVLRTEKTRISEVSGGKEATLRQQDASRMSDIWVGLRAYLRCRTVPDEQRYLEGARLQMDHVLDDVRKFRIPLKTPKDEAVQLVQSLLHRVDWCESLYPSNKFLWRERPAWRDSDSVLKLETLRSWDNNHRGLRMQIGILQKFMRSDKLDGINPSSSPPPSSSSIPVVAESVSPPVSPEITRYEMANGQLTSFKRTKELLEPSTFVERILQEGSLNRLFAQNTFESLNKLIVRAKDTMIKFSKAFERLRLPSYRDDLTVLANFAPSLMQEVLRIRLQNAKLLKSDLSELSLVLLQQLTDDFRTGLTHATAVKKSWMKIMDEEPNWDMCLPDADRRAFDETLTNALKFFFRLLDTHILTGSNKTLDSKDTEIVEGEWSFLKSAVAEIQGGDVLLGEHYRLVYIVSTPSLE